MSKETDARERDAEILFLKSASLGIEATVEGSGAGIIAEIVKAKIPDVSVSANAAGKQEESAGVIETLKNTLLPGDILALHRNNAGITQTELSNETGISVSALSMMERSRRPINPQNAKKLAKALNCDTADFL